MALNPPLLPDGRPAGLLGEWNVLERRGVVAALSGTGRRPLKAAGRLVLTTVRLVFVVTAPGGELRAFDVPLQGITGEVFKQPVFGANRLEMDVAPVPGRGLDEVGSPVHVTLTFNEGGCNTLLKLYFRLLDTVRRATTHAEAQRALESPQVFMQEQQVCVRGGREDAVARE
jgi:hypothetical protein